MKKNIIIIFIILLTVTITSCNCANDTPQTTNEIASIFENGDLMTNISTDPNGNALVYPSGDASITSQVKVWEPDFNSLGITTPTNV